MKKIYAITFGFLMSVQFLTAQTTQTFNYTGSVQTFTVPSCVSSIVIQAKGAQGGIAAIGGTGGLGGIASGTLNVTPGDILSFYIGGSNGYNGGGSGGANGNPVFGFGGYGGGASDVRLNGTTLQNRVIVAGGGGGGGSNGTWPSCQVAGPAGNGGDGGGLIGSTGTFGVGNPCNCQGGGGAGATGGTQVSGGIHGAYAGNTACLRANWTAGQDGTLGQGGNGSAIYYNGTGGSGGGGGGYYGGGSGGSGSDTTPGGGGGGGSSYTGGVTSGSTTSATWSGNGIVTITYTSSAPPTPGVITGSSSVCANATGNYSIVSIPGATTYTWTVPNGSTINSGQGTTSINLTAGNTSGNISVTVTVPCGTSSPSTFVLTIIPSPTVTATSSSASVCTGGSVTLTGGGAATYAWDNNVVDAISFVPTATTTYMVTGTDVNGCVNTATTTVTVNPLPVVIASSSSASVCTGGSVILTGGGASTYTWDNNVIDAVSFVPSATTTYMVTGTDANGCVNTSTTTVTVNSLPLVSLGPNIIQCGGTAILDAGNIGSIYLWSDLSTSQTLTVSTSGTYIVVVTNVNGCMGSDSAVVTINSNPTVTASASSVLVCVDDATVSLTGTPTGGVWSGPGVSGSNFNPTAAGVGAQTAIYSYTDANGCSGNATVSIQVNACVGFVENTLANGVSVYPNPNNGSFTLSVNANVAELTIKITDMQGRVVYASVDKNVSAGFVKQISLDTQSSGMYLMHIIANGEQQTKKISVQK
jgi:hypothetical protein